MPYLPSLLSVTSSMTVGNKIEPSDLQQMMLSGGCNPSPWWHRATLGEHLYCDISRLLGTCGVITAGVYHDHSVLGPGSFMYTV